MKIMNYHKTLKAFTGLFVFLILAPLMSNAAEEPEESEISEDVEVTESTESSKAVEKQYVLPDVSAKRSQSLLEYMKLFDREDEVITLETTIFTTEAPDENSQGETEKNSFYGLFLEEESGNPQGAILILHDSQHHGHWPEVIAPIREYLPQFGWATLSIELPDAPKRTRIAREVAKPIKNNEKKSEEQSEENEENNESNTEENSITEQNTPEEPTDNEGTVESSELETEAETEEEKSAEPSLPRLQELPSLAENESTKETTPGNKKLSPETIYQQLNTNRIIAAINYLKSRNQENLVLIGYGSGAAWAIDYVQKQDKNSKTASKGLTLITIDALTSKLEPTKMHEQIKDIKVPYLDLINPRKTRAVKLAQKRLKILKRSKHSNYQQIITPIMSNYRDTESPTSRRIRGWLMNNAEGKLIKR